MKVYILTAMDRPISVHWSYAEARIIKNSISAVSQQQLDIVEMELPTLESHVLHVMQNTNVEYPDHNQLVAEIMAGGYEIARHLILGKINPPSFIREMLSIIAHNLVLLNAMILGRDILELIMNHIHSRFDWEDQVEEDIPF